MNVFESLIKQRRREASMQIRGNSKNRSMRILAQQSKATLANLKR